MPEIFITSDSHFGHRRILDFCQDSRQWAKNDVDKMDQNLIDSWNSVVKDEDIVYHLGDFTFYRSKTKNLKIFDSLKGKKYLIRGNHEKEALSLPWLGMYHYYEIEDCILFHYPIEDWNRRYHGSYHLHGHVHSSTEMPFRHINNRLDIGADNMGPIPKTIQQLKDICNERLV